MLVSQLGYPQFELVVYTKENALTFYPIIEGLDPGNQVWCHAAGNKKRGGIQRFFLHFSF